MADERTVGRTTIVVTALVALACVVGVVIANAPANWLAAWLADRTDGAVLLADARGTIWSGSAVMAVAAPRTAADPGAPTSAMALPGRVTWALEFERVLAPVLHLTHDGVLLQPLAARVRDGALVVDAGTVVLPAAMLRLTGAPLNTLLPEARCTLQWDGLRFGGGPPVAEGTLRIASFGLAISPVKPLGDYLVSWTSGATGLAWQLATERGPLVMEGGGNLLGRRAQARIVVRIAPDTATPIVAQLNPLLDMLGRRSATEAVIDTGGGAQGDRGR